MSLHRRAVQTGNYRLVAALLVHKAHTKIVDNNGFTPLSQACFGDRITIVTELLKHKAKVNTLNNYRHTPFMYAIEHSDIKIVNLLLAHGPLIDAQILVQRH